MSSVAVEEALLALKIAFLVLLYLFIWRIVRTAAKDLRLPQESFILAPQQQAAGVLGSSSGIETGRLVAVDGSAEYTLDSSAITIGRSAENDVTLEDDEFASARHARVEPRRDGVWVEDIGSTNGTYVNGARIAKPRRLKPGDVIRVGERDFRYQR